MLLLHSNITGLGLNQGMKLERTRDKQQYKCFIKD